MKFRELLLRSALLAILFTGPPIVLLIILRALDFLDAFSILGWGIFALCWTVLAVVFADRYRRNVSR